MMIKKQLLLTARWVQMESSKVNGTDAQVLGKVQSLGEAEGVASVRLGRQAESLCQRAGKGSSVEIFRLCRLEAK